MQTPTPLMQQYFSIKSEYPHALILFQVGDFYELFFDDAKTAASVLGIALTKRGAHNGEPIPLCGVPLHALDHYLPKLIRGGHNVTICDQLETAVPGKMVARGITRVLTPATLTDSQLLDAKTASYLLSFCPTPTGWGLVFGELLSAQLFATTLPANAYKTLDAELVRYFPDEILLPDDPLAQQYQTYVKQQGYYTALVPLVDQGASRAWMSRQLGRDTAQKVCNHEGLRTAVSMMHSYLGKHQQASLEQFRAIHFYQPEDFLMLDAATQKNLDLAELFTHLDHAATAMGSRTIKKWMQRPLVAHDAIEQRLDVVDLFTSQPLFLRQLEKHLQQLGDLERIVGRIALRRATMHDYLQVKVALCAIPAIKAALAPYCQSVLLAAINERLLILQELADELERALHTDSSQSWIIKPGYNGQLDRLRELAHNSHAKIVELETREQTKTGIGSLKIRYNNVHGYYVEVTKTHADSVPDYYVRQQTLVGRERFMIPELRQLQGEILTAQQDSSVLEQQLFEQIKSMVATVIGPLRHMCAALAKLDALLGLSGVSYEHHYVRPVFNNNRTTEIVGGKHPVIAALLGAKFIPNDTVLSPSESLWIITGPNMGGKSTYLRQVALLQIMAQMGCYVPAQRASLAVVDRIFTRIGAGDQLSAGKSTFLVEMEETATICTQATSNSLVVLDEVGRGTSTFDGLAIAQAVVEYLHAKVGVRCLFATHYHELTALEGQLPGVVSYHAASTKGPAGIMFLYKMVRGTADGSFGVEVAKMAGLPQEIIIRAGEILDTLSQQQKI